MLVGRVIIVLSLLGVTFGIRCYAGMMGTVDGSKIGQTKLKNCGNETKWCSKLPASSDVGRKHYEGAQYSCGTAECRKSVCEKRNAGGIICCCDTDGCNSSGILDLFLGFILSLYFIYNIL